MQNAGIVKNCGARRGGELPVSANGGKNTKKIILAVVTLLLLVACVISICLISSYVKEQESDRIQNEALELLESREGEYNAQTIVLHNTSRTKASELAARLNAQLRITKQGSFATLTLPEGVTIKDVFADRENRDVISLMSPDFSVSVTEIDNLFSDEIPEQRLPVRPQYSVSDVGYSSQTYLDYLNMDNVWNTTKGSGITIAVIDTGIDTDHPEFLGKISEYSYNATEDKIVKDYLLENGEYDWSLVEDTQGHGTAVTGVIAASMNGEGVVGIAPEVTVIVIKAECSSSGKFGSSADLLFGLYYAIERDVDIVNMSFGGKDSIYSNAALLAVDSDIICVAAAGNDGSAELTYPAADENVIGVGALAENSWTLADYSNYGENVDIVAPGSTYTTLIDGGYGVSQGTSLACPAAVGSIALYKSINHYATFDSLTENLYASGYDLGEPGEDFYYGFGAIDISALVLETRGTVKFNMLTSEVENIEQIFVRSHTLQRLPEPERTYAVFGGWYYDADCTDPVNYYVDEFTADLTLYAKWENEEDGIPFTYVELADGTVEIRSYIGKRRYITIPEYIDGKLVSSIGESAFEGQTNLREITLPASITIIKDEAFADCINLVGINMPISLETIGYKAFLNNVRLSSVSFVEGSAIKTIASYAFANCSKLSYVSFPAACELGTIGEFAFRGCTALARFEVPGTVTALSGSAFYRTTRLTQYGIIGSSANFAVIDGVLVNAAGNEIVAFPSNRSEAYSIPDGITGIGRYAFAYSRIPAVSLNNVSYVGEYAFENANLSELVIPDTVKDMGNNAFAMNESLTSLEIGDGLSDIPDGAFYGALSLTEVSIPAGIGSIGVNAFFGSGLETLTFEEESRLYIIRTAAFSACNISRITIPASVNEIGDHAFSCNRLISVGFEDGSQLNTIGGLAFYGNVILSEMELPEGLINIGGSAFSNTSSLTAVVLPSTLENIGGFAFESSGLTEITLPKALKTLGEGAFAYCHSLENIFVDSSNAVYKDVDGVVYSIDGTTLVEYPAGNPRSSYTAVSGITKVGAYAFYGSYKLASVILPDGVTEIEHHAFYFCEGMTSYDLSNTLVTVGDEAFAHNTAIKTYVFPNTLVSIGKYAFSYNESLTGLTMPDSLYQIGSFAFAYDYKLEQIIFNDTATLPRISYAAFANTGLKSFRIPASVSTVAQYAFKGNNKLNQITFAANSKLESVSAYMFQGCTALKEIVFENGSHLTSIQAHGFDGLIRLETVDFGNAALTNIDNYAFRYCEMLTSVNVPDGVTYIGRYAFYGCKKLTRLDLPASIEFIGENAFYYAENLEIFFAGNTLPLYLSELWDNGIRGYYVGIKNIYENESWRYAELIDGGISIIEYKGTEKFVDLTAVDFGGNIVSIGGSAFRGNEIEGIVLPDSLSEIHRYAFAYTALDRIEIPDSVTFIGQYAFISSAVSEVSFGENSEIKVIEQYAFYNTGNLRTFKIPAALTDMGRYAFAKSGIKDLDLSDCTLAELPEGAFMGADVTEVALPDSLSIINHHAFRDCLSLTKVTFGSGELQLMSNVFYNTGLTEVYIPDSLTYIGEYSLVGLKNLTEFTVSITHPKYTAIDGLLYSKDGKKLIAAPAGKTGEIELPVSVEVLGFGAFENSALTGISFHPDSNILTFGYRCFYNSAIEELHVPKTVISFDFYAFAMCKNLKTVRFAEDNRLKGIYEGAFYGCLELEDIVIPESVVEISDYAFYGCTSLEQLPFADNADITGIYDYAFAYTNFDEIILPDSLLDLGNYAFFGAKLKKVTVPDTNKENLLMGIGVFEECNRLEEITLPFIGASFDEKEIAWFGYIFGAGSYFANSSYVPESLKKVTVTEGITFIGKGAFYGLTELEEVVFPSSVTGIFRYAFTDTDFKYELKGTIAPNIGYDKYGDVIEDGTLFADQIGRGITGNLTISPYVTKLNHSLFENCYNLKGVVLPDSITTLDSNMFKNCTSLTDVRLPAYLTIIDQQTFLGCSSLKKIIIPDEVTEIRMNAFYGCSSLEDIELPDSVTVIGIDAFSKCESLSAVYVSSVSSWLNITFGDEDANPLVYAKNLYVDGELLTELDIPEGISVIHSYVFSGCSALASITVPVGVTSIGDSAFKNCTGLASLIIPDSVTYLGNNAFSGCTGFIDVVLGDGVKDLSPFTFKNSTSLRNLAIGSGVTQIPSSCFVNCTSLESVTLSEGLTRIESSAFYNCSALKSIVIPDGVKSIASSAFENCIKIESIVVPDTATSIGSSAFRNCQKLKSVKIPEGVTVIDQYTFKDCNSLESITLPSSLTNVNSRAFENCNALRAVHISDVEAWCKIKYGSNALSPLYYAKNLYLNGAPITELVIPEGLTQIGTYAFYYCKDLTKVTLPESLTSIGAYAFQGCSALKEIIIPDGVTEIYGSAFYDCSSLESVEMPNSLISIGSNAFRNCASLKSITIPDGVQTVDSNAFNGCAQLTEIVLPDSVTYLGYEVLKGCTSIRRLVIGNGITSVSSVDFEQLTELVEVVIGDGIADLYYVKLKDNKNLEKVVIGKGVTVIKADFVSGCTALKDITLGEGVTSIESNAFKNCTSLTEIDLPAGLTEIGANAFYQCSGLKEIYIPDGVTALKDQTFYGCTGLKSVRLSENLVSIGYYAFKSCISLESMTIPEKVTTIGTAFVGCTSLSELTIPDSVTEIRYGAFRDCTALKSVTLGKGVRTIAGSAFYGCNALNAVYISSTEDWCRINFGDEYANPLYYAVNLYENGKLVTEAVIPDDVTSVSPYLFYNCSSLTAVTLGSGVTNVGTDAFKGCIKLFEVKNNSNINLVIASMDQGYVAYYAKVVIAADGTKQYKNNSEFAYIETADGFKFSFHNNVYQLIAYLGDENTVTLPAEINGSSYIISYGFIGAKNVILSEGITKLESKAFYGCAELESISIPSSLTSVGDSAFEGCSKLKAVYITDVAAWFNIGYSSSYFSNPLSQAKNLYVNGELVSELTVPEGVTKINFYSMQNCANVKRIALPESLRTISDYAFAEFVGLESIEISNDVTYVGGAAFKGCKNLTNVTLPQGLSSVKRDMFLNCSSLESIVIPDSVTQIEASAFQGCSLLSSINLPKNVSSIGDKAFFGTSLSEFVIHPENTSFSYYGGLLLNKNRTQIISVLAGTKDVIIPAEIASLGSAFTNNTVIESISFEDGSLIENLNDYVFSGCSSLKSITFPIGLKSIGYQSFANCTSLTEITITDSISTIRNYAFYGCSALERVTVGAGLNSVYGSAFEGCNALSEVHISDILKWCTTDFSNSNANPLSIAGKLYLNGELVTEIDLPDTKAGIGSFVFYGYLSLERISLPDSMQSIGSYAFYGCTGLEVINLPGALMSIGEYAFYDCVGIDELNLPGSLTSVSSFAFYGCTGLGSLVIPDSVTELGYQAFYNCTGLREVVIGNGVTSTSAFNFSGNQNLSRIVIGNSVNSISRQTFYQCTSLTEISLPSSLTHILDSAFYGCSSLAKVHISDVDSWFKIRFEYAANPLLNGAGLYVNGELVTEVTVPDGITEIGEYAFYGYKELKSISIPEGVTSIGNNAFYGCTGLTSVTVPDSLTTIGAYAFSGCSALKNVHLHDGITSIGAYAFYGCSGLESIKIPKGITSIPNNMLNGCTGIEKLVLHNGITQIGANAFNSCKFTEVHITDLSWWFGLGFQNSSYNPLKGGATLYVDGTPLTVLELPEGTTQIPAYAFYGCSSLTEIVIPEGVTSIGEYAFSNCTNVKKIVIADSVTSLGSNIFQGCNVLETVVIGDGITDLGLFNFQSSKIKEIVIGDGITSIPSQTFNYCTSLANVVIGNGVTQIGANAFNGCSALSSIVIPDSVKTVGNYAFNNCKALTSVVIGDGIISLNTNVFNNCYGITDIVVGDGMTSINGLPISNSLRSIVLGKGITAIKDSGFKNITGLERIELPDTLTSIGSFAFSGCQSLQSIVIPDSVTYMGEQVFNYCVSLQSVTLSKSLTVIKSYTFYNCTSLTCVTLHEGITEIENNAFEYDRSLTAVVLPDTMRIIGSGAFSNCTSLGTIELPEGLTDIRSDAFEHCPIKEIKIPDTVTSIGASAFYLCEKLETVEIGSIDLWCGITFGNEYANPLYYAANLSVNGETVNYITVPESVTSLRAYVFYNYNKLVGVSLPAGLTNIGDRAFEGCKSLMSITFPSSLSQIGSYAFYNCTELYEVVNNSSVSLTIGKNANGYAAYYAKIVVNADGTKQLIGGKDFIYIDTPDGFRFSYYNGQYRLVAYYGEEETVTLPLDIDGNEYVLKNGFLGAKNVIIPEGITSINSYAFYGCSTLRSIVIPDSVTAISEYAFANCSALANMSLGNGVEKINTNAFAGCKKLESIVLPDSVTVIGGNAFNNCASLVSITVGNAIYSIGSNAFDGTAYYNDSENWSDGCLYLGIHLLRAGESTIDAGKGGAIAVGALDGCYNLRRIVMNRSEARILASLTNLETIVLTDLPSFSIGNYFVTVPMTLKVVVLKEGCEVKTKVLFSGLTGINIYAEIEKTNVQWDRGYSNWNNGNRVYYGGEWIETIFRDESGRVIGDTAYYSINEIIRQPFVNDVLSDGEFKRFIGWDINGDGIADFIPATSVTNIEATALYETHLLGDWSCNEPTCTESGYRERACLECGEVFVTEVIPALGHSSVSVKENVSEPSCKEKGYYDLVFYCSVCELEVSRERKIIMAKGHTPATVVAENIVNAGCTTDGSYDSVIYCSECDEELSRVKHVIKAVGHSLLIHGKKAPSCTEIGWNDYSTCSNCDYTTYEEIAALGHDEVSHDAKASTCTAIGWNAYETCSRCDYSTYVEIPAKGHTYGTWIDEIPETCEGEGTLGHYHCSECDKDFDTNKNILESLIIEALGHTGGTATCTAKAECTRCHELYGSMPEHVYTAEDATDAYLKSAATCTSKAVYYKNCATCDKAGTATFEYGILKAHSYIEKVDDAYLKASATCTSKAVYYKSCSACGVEGTETFEVGDAPSHNYQTTWSSDATSHWHECSKCGDNKDNAPHTAGAAATENAAQTCTVCGYVITPALGHTHNYDSIKKDEANHWKECACGEKNEITAHTWNNGEVTKEATVYEEGVKTYTCTYCSITKTESVPKNVVNIEDVDSGVMLEIPSNSQATLPAGTIIDVVEKSNEEISDQILGEFAETAETVVTALGVYDLNLLLDGVKIQPNGLVEVTLPALNFTTEYDRIVVVYIASDGSYEECKTTVNADGTVSFETDHFSKYAVIGINEEESDNGLGIGAIVAIIVGALLVVGVGGFAIYWFVIKKKAKLTGKVATDTADEEQQ